MAYGTVNADLMTTSDGVSSSGLYGFKNRLINGNMVIDQRNAGAATANTISGYVVDRWQVLQSTSGKVIAQQNAGSVSLPAGFTKYLGVTSQSAYSVSSSDYYLIRQVIEGFNFSDLAWGTANASSVTLSFRVYSSLTGTFGGCIQNASETRSYPFSYSIPVANTWTTISITVAGDTSGTWIGATNAGAANVCFSYGTGTTFSGTAGSWASADYFSATGATSVVGTNGATFYITGVQLEKGSTATSFDYRPYGTELALCQRYYYQASRYLGLPITSDTLYGAGINFPVTMRATPTLSSGAVFVVRTGSAGTVAISTGVTGIIASPDSVSLYNASNNWTVSSSAQISVTGGFTAEL